MTAPITDFEGNELRLGDEVITADLSKRGGMFRRGEIIKLCSSSVRIALFSSNQQPLAHDDIYRASMWISLVKRNPCREAELTATKQPEVMEL